jgi:hypothetical protein
MLRRSRAASRIVIPALFMIVSFTTVSVAKTDQDRAEFGRNITVEPGQSAGDTACFNCSVYVRGDVNGDIAVFAGRVVVEGKVKGDIAVFWGNVRVEDGGQVGGDVAVFGGALRRAPTAAVHGSVATFGRGWVLIPVLVMVVIVWLIVALIVWLVTRRRRVPAPEQPVGQP